HYTVSTKKMPSIGAGNLRSWTTSLARALQVKVWPRTMWGCRSITTPEDRGCHCPFLIVRNLRAHGGHWEIAWRRETPRNWPPVSAVGESPDGRVVRR